MAAAAPEEIAELTSSSELPAAESVAGRFAAKEACAKALGTGLRTPMGRVRCADWPVVDLVAPPGLAAAAVVLPPTAGQSGSGGSSTV